MAVAPHIQNQIEQDLAALQEGDLRRPGVSMIRFIEAYSRLLAQAEQDQEMLAKARFDCSRMAYYNALLSTFALACAERGAAGCGPKPNLEQYKEGMALAAEDRERLMVVARYIAEQCHDPEVERSCRAVAKGRGEQDALTDIIDLAGIVRAYPQYAAQIAPGGVQVDSAYASQAEKRAVDLLQLRGTAVSEGKPEQDHAIMRQNKLLTLCLRAESHIRKYAAAAFHDDRDHYQSRYAVRSVRPKKRARRLSAPAEAEQAA